MGDSYLITGATGFVGRELCRSFSADSKSFVTLQRKSVPGLGSTSDFSADLALAQIPGACLDGVSTVIHLAGMAHVDAPAEQHEQLNQEATLRLAESAAAAGVGHFIFLSSVKAMGPSREGLRREEGDLGPVDSDYSRSKRAAEIGLEIISRESGMRTTSLRSALVYGADARANIRSLIGSIARGLPGLPERGGRSMVAIDDLVAAINAVVSQGGNGYSCYIVCGDCDYSARHIQDATRDALKVGSVRWTPPLFLWRLAAGCRDLMSPGLLPGDSTFAKLFDSELYSSRALQQATGWKPQSTFELHLPAILKAMSLADGADG
jgi:UDP-glucose 4-epimerase